MKSRNFLSQGNFLKAANALLVIKEDIEAGKHTHATLAKYLTEKLECTVTPGNIKGLLEATEINVPRRRQEEEDRLDALESRVEALEKRMEGL